MNRRVFIGSLAGGFLAAPLAAEAQQTGKVYRIGFLGVASPSGYALNVEALRLGLRDLGYVDGKNLAIEYRWAEGKLERLPSLAQELIRLNLDVLVVATTPGSLAAKAATATIPIVNFKTAKALGLTIPQSLLQRADQVIE